MVFRVSIALVLLLVLLAGIAPGPFNTVVQSMLAKSSAASAGCTCWWCSWPWCS
jgi:hypothetical protein